MSIRRPYILPEIAPWPSHREVPTQNELEEVRGLAGASEEELSLRRKEVETYLADASLLFLNIAADRVVDLYVKAGNHIGCAHAKNYELQLTNLSPYAEAVLNVLVDRHTSLDLEPPTDRSQRGLSDPKAAQQKTPKDIAWYVGKKAGLLQDYNNTFNFF